MAPRARQAPRTAASGAAAYACHCDILQFAISLQFLTLKLQEQPFFSSPTPDVAGCNRSLQSPSRTTNPYCAGTYAHSAWKKETHCNKNSRVPYLHAGVNTSRTHSTCSHVSRISCVPHIERAGLSRADHPQNIPPRADKSNTHASLVWPEAPVECGYGLCCVCRLRGGRGGTGCKP